MVTADRSYPATMSWMDVLAGVSAVDDRPISIFKGLEKAFGQPKQVVLDQRRADRRCLLVVPQQLRQPGR